VIKKHDLVSPSSNGLLKALEKGDNLFPDVSTPREAALDTEFLSLAAQLGAEQSYRLVTGFTTYDPEDYISKVKAIWGADQQDNPNRCWTGFYDEYCDQFISNTPKCSFMYGPLQKEIHKRTIKPRAQKEKVGKKVVPEDVRNTKKDKKSETTRRVEQIDTCLSQLSSPLNFWDFVVDPKSFTHTIENIFHFSFLVKDGRAKIEHEESQYITATNEPPLDGTARRNQGIIKMDYPTWQKNYFRKKTS